MQLLKTPPPQPAATVAQVSYAGPGSFGAVAASEITQPLVFAPRGISYLPCTGDHLLLLPAEGTSTCLGALSATAGLAPGELRLRSSGGAELLLCANGDIRLNGVTITKSGQILTP